jgi:hypothetical protein
MGRAEIARAQTADMPSLVSAGSTCIQPISRLGPGVSDHRFYHCSDGPSGPPTGERPSAGHHVRPVGVGHEVRNPRAVTPYLLQCCVFEIS